MRSATAAAATALVALTPFVSAQKALPDNKVPFIGGGVLNVNDPRLVNYTLSYKPPFEYDYGNYYWWSVNNNSVAIANFTGYDVSDGYVLPDGSYAMFPFFSVNEGTPKPINKTALFPSSAAKGHEHSRDFSAGQKCQKFNKILHIIFENEVYDWTMTDPYWQLLASRGQLLTNSHAITHPSLPNYAAILAGDFFGIAAEDFYNINATTIYDLLDAKDIDYATYAEWYSPIATHRGENDCNNYIFNGPMDSTNPDWNAQVYRRLDVPALLFSSYTSDYNRCSKIYNATAQFAEDVKSQKLPAYSYYVPDMTNNAHDPQSDSDYVHQSTTSGIWLNAFLDLYLPALEKQGTLVVATFDEATWQNDDDITPNNDNHVVSILFGAGIIPDTKDDTYITHYGLLRGAIQNFGLGSLGRNDTNATNGNLYDILF